MASLLNIIPPRTPCSATTSCGGTRSNSGERLGNSATDIYPPPACNCCTAQDTQDHRHPQMGCVKSGGVTVDNLDFEGEKLWIRRWVFGHSPLDPGNGAGRTPSQHESRCGQRFISQSQNLDRRTNGLPGKSQEKGPTQLSRP